MLKKIAILLILSLLVLSCGEESNDNIKDDGTYNTTDYVYLIVELEKGGYNINLPENLFKINGKSESDTENTFNYINSILEQQGCKILSKELYPDNSNGLSCGENGNGSGVCGR